MRLNCHLFTKYYKKIQNNIKTSFVQYRKGITFDENNLGHYGSYALFNNSDVPAKYMYTYVSDGMSIRCFGVVRQDQALFTIQ